MKYAEICSRRSQSKRSSIQRTIVKLDAEKLAHACLVVSRSQTLSGGGESLVNCLRAIRFDTPGKSQHAMSTALVYVYVCLSPSLQISESQLQNITCNGSKLQQNGADTVFVDMKKYCAHAQCDALGIVVARSSNHPSPYTYYCKTINVSVPLMVLQYL